MLAVLLLAAAIDIKAQYTKFEYRIPMRDGVKLFTSVFTPKDSSTKFPILLTRTPYGIDPYGKDAYPEHLGPSREFAQDKFIFVYQDVRGRYMSEGQFVDIRPVKDALTGPADTDESTDTFDTIAWLVKDNPPQQQRQSGTYRHFLCRVLHQLRNHPRASGVGRRLAASTHGRSVHGR